jgi:hypothetical protein
MPHKPTIREIADEVEASEREFRPVRDIGGMPAFDQLPPRIRATLTEMPLNFSSEFALQQLAKGMSEAELIAMLEKLKKSIK